MELSSHHTLYISLQGPPSAYFGTLQQMEGMMTTALPLAQALQMNLQEKYSLILVDCLTGLSEIEGVCRKLRAKYVKPLLVLVEEADEDFLIRLYATGVDECIHRPNDANLLAAKVRTWLRWSMALQFALRQDTRGQVTEQPRYSRPS